MAAAAPGRPARAVTAARMAGPAPGVRAAGWSRWLWAAAVGVVGVLPVGALPLPILVATVATPWTAPSTWQPAHVALPPCRAGKGDIALHAARHDCRHGRAIPAPTDAAPLWPGVLANATTALQRRRAADIPEALRRVASVVVHARSAEAPPAAAAQQFLRALGKAVPTLSGPRLTATLHSLVRILNGTGWHLAASAEGLAVAAAVTERIGLPGVTDPLTANATARLLWVVARLQLPDTPALDRLADKLASPDQCADLGAHNVAMAAWALAALPHRSPPVLAALARRCLELPLRGQSLSNVAWAFAKLGYRDLALMACLAGRAARQLAAFKPQELANVVWAFATLDIFAPELMAPLQLHLQEPGVLNRLNAQELTCVVWACVRLGVMPNRLLSLAAGRVGQPAFRALTPEAVSKLAWAFAVAGERNEPLLRALCQRLLDPALLPRFEPRHLVRTLWAFAALQYNASDAFAAVAARLARPGAVAGFQPVDIALLPWAYAVLGLACPELVATLTDHAVQTGLFASFRLKHAVNLLWAVGRMGAAPPGLLPALTPQLLAPGWATQLLPLDIANLAWAYTALGSWNEELAVAMADRARQLGNATRFVPGQLSAVLWAYAKARSPAAPLLLEWAAAGALEDAAYLARCRGKDLALFLWALATAGLRPVRPVVRVCRALSQPPVLQGLDEQSLALTVWALARMRVRQRPLLIRLAARAVAPQVSERFTAVGVSTMLWALVALRLRPLGLMLELLDAAERLAMEGELNPRAMSLTAWAVARLSTARPALDMPMQRRTEAFLAQLGQWALRPGCLGALPGWAIASMAWALARMGVPSARLMERIVAQATRRVEEFQPPELATAVWAAVHTGQRPAALAAVLADRLMAADVRRTLGPPLLVAACWAVALCGVRNPELARAVAADLAEADTLSNVSPRRVALLMWAMAEFRVLDQTLVAAVQQYSATATIDLRPLIQLAWAEARLALVDRRLLAALRVQLSQGGGRDGAARLLLWDAVRALWTLTAVDEVDDRLFLALLTRLVELAADVGRWPAAAVAMLFPCVVHATLHRAAMPSTAAFLALMPEFTARATATYAAAHVPPLDAELAAALAPLVPALRPNATVAGYPVAAVAQWPRRAGTWDEAADASTSLVIEVVDGHHCVDRGDGRGHLTGEMQLRRRQLAALGAPVLLVPLAPWRRLAGPAQREQFLRRLLQGGAGEGDA